MAWRRSHRSWSLKSVVRRWLALGETNAVTSTLLGAKDNSLNQSGAMGLSAVWACVGLLSETIATLPIGVYRKTNGGREPITDHPLYSVIHERANSHMTAVEFWQAFIASMLLWGNGYAEKLFNVRGQVIGLELLLPARVMVRDLASGSFEYSYRADNRTRIIPEGHMFHVPAFSNDGRVGVSPVRVGAQIFAAALSAQTAASKTFDNGLMPTTYFKMDRILQKEQRNDFRENLLKVSGAVHAGHAPLLEGGMSVGTIGIDPADAQLLESRRFSIEEICRWFRVPPFLVGHTEKSTAWGSGIEQLMIGFIAFGLRPWLVRIEQGIKRSLIAPAEQEGLYAEYSVEGLLRGDSAARRELFASALQNGWMNRNQVAGLENMPRIPGGEVFTVQSNLIRLDSLRSTTTV